jgi:crotonobetainyl-CoA:carnitine CoA-transferase CaiB-like acyl-CoA transferase
MHSSLKPLDGLVVLDLSAGLPGPYCSQLLADLGATVRKVERPSGDYLRSIDDEMVRAYSRGKSVLTLDLKSPTDRERFWRELDGADVLLEGMRPGVMDRLGLSYDEVFARAPRVIYCSISGYGQDGPLRDRPGHDLNYLGYSGALRDRRTQEPLCAPALPVADLASGAIAAVAILAAVRERDASGRGARLDVSMHDVALDWTYAWSGALSQHFPGHAIFLGSDEEAFTVGAIEDHFWARLCRALDAPTLAQAPYADVAGRTQHYEELSERLRRTFAERPAAQWLKLLTEADVPVGPVLPFADASRHNHAKERRVLSDGTDYRPAFPAKWNGRALRAAEENT